MDGKSGSHGEGGDGGQWGVGGVVDGKTEVGVWWRDPGTIEATSSIGLIVGGD